MSSNSKRLRGEIDVLLEVYGSLERAHDILIKSLSDGGPASFHEASNFVVVAVADYIVALSNIGLTLQE